MNARLRRVAAGAPLAAVLGAVPVATLLLALLGWLSPLVGLGGVVLTTVALSLLLSRDLRLIGSGRAAVGAEMVAADARAAQLARRADVLEQLVEANRATAATATETTARLFAELVRAEEATRAHLAAELHDTVAQTLSQAIVITPLDPQTGMDSLRDAEDQLRAVMARMRPPELADGDLARAVADLCLDMENRYGVPVEVTWPEESVTLTSALATTVYRFTQESLLNAAVHADGVDVRLEVRLDGGWLEVRVADGGPGYDPAAVVSKNGRHVGLRLARERARLAGGSIEVLSEIGKGTTNVLRLPLPGAAPAQRLGGDHAGSTAPLPV